MYARARDSTVEVERIDSKTIQETSVPQFVPSGLDFEGGPVSFSVSFLILVRLLRHPCSCKGQ